LQTFITQQIWCPTWTVTLALPPQHTLPLLSMEWFNAIRVARLRSMYEQQQQTCNKVFTHTAWMIYENNEPVHWFEDPQQGTHYMSPSSALVRCVWQIRSCWKSPQDGSLFHWRIRCTIKGAVPTVTRALHSAGCGYRRYPEKLLKYTDVASLLVILFSHKEYQGWMETTGKIRQIKVTENSFFYCSRITWCSTRADTLTSRPLPWYFWKSHVDNVFLSLFNHALPKFKVRPVLPDCRVEADWPKCAMPPT